MAVTRKPSGQSPPPADVEAFIRGGGSEPTESVVQGPGMVQAELEGRTGVQVVTLRLPLELLGEVDALRKGRRPAPSRHQWLLEALYEKVEREQSKGE